MKIKLLTISTLVSLSLCGAAISQTTANKFYLPQAKKVFKGEIKTAVGTLHFNNQYPSKKTVKLLLNRMDFQGATQAYLWSLPMVSFANMQYFNDEVLKVPQGDMISLQGLEDVQGILTANATTPYIISAPNLTKTGPMVIEMPVGASAGMVNDAWQRLITDIGIPGPDKGKGAKYLILPPNFTGKTPTGYRVFQSPTNSILIGFRILTTDPAKAKLLKKNYHAYPYNDRLKPRTNAVSGASAPYYYGPPRGMAYWERLSKIINSEVVAPRDRFFMALLRRVGIEKGKPFNPSLAQRKILKEAVLVGEAMAQANDLAKRDTAPYWPGGSWKLALDFNLNQRAKFYDQLDQRAAWFYEAISVSNGMVSTTPGVGSVYLANYTSKDGGWLKGGKYYTLHVPPNPPAKRFWSIAVYSWDTRTLIINKQKRANLSSRQGLIKNSDGSVDLYFGPTAPKDKTKNWVQTLPGQGWWVYLRFYGPTQAYFDKNWVMPDFVQVEKY